MKLKIRILSNELNNQLKKPNITGMLLGTTVIVTEYPQSLNIGVLTIFEDYNKEKNEFQVRVKKFENEEIGCGSLFKSLIISKNRETIIQYNIRELIFKEPNTCYIIELFNEGELIDRFKIESTLDMGTIYENTSISGIIDLI